MDIQGAIFYMEVQQKGKKNLHLYVQKLAIYLPEIITSMETLQPSRSSKLQPQAAHKETYPMKDTGAFFTHAHWVGLIQDNLFVGT